MLLLRERAKFSPARRKVKIAAGIAKAMSRTNFGLTTPPEEIAAVHSKNEFLEVPIDFKMCRNSETKFSSLHTIRAFTLIEVLLALAVTVIGLIPLLHLLTASILMNDSAWNLSQAAMIGNTRLAEIISQNDIKIGTDKGSVECREKEIVFDWQSKVTEAYIEELQETNPAGLWKVTVTVMWPEGQSQKQISLTTFVFFDKTVTKAGAI